MKRIVIFALLAATAASALGCAATVKDGGQAPVPRSDFCVDGLLVTFTTDKKDYGPNDPINATVTFTNCSDGILQFPVGKDGDERLFFNAIFVSNIAAIDTFARNGAWLNDMEKNVKIITLRAGEKYQIYVPAIVPPQGEYMSIFQDEFFKMYLVYRDYSWGHAGKQSYARNPEGKYWEGICISKPVAITFGLEDRPDDGE